MTATEISDGGAEQGSADGSFDASFDASFTDGLAPRLMTIENQPLDERAAAYTELHDQLRDRLEGGDVPAAVRR
jgi:hypothetical protein